MNVQRSVNKKPLAHYPPKPNKKYPAFFIPILVFFLCLFVFAWGHAEEATGEAQEQGTAKQQKALPVVPDQPEGQSNTLASKQDAADQAFLNKKKEILEEFRIERENLTSRVSELEKETKVLENEVQAQQILDLPHRFLLELAFLADWGVIIALWFFPIMILNHVLYLALREKTFFSRHRLLIIISFVVIELLFFMPLIAGAETTSNAVAGELKSPTVETQTSDSFEKMLKDISALLKMSDVEKALYILTNTKEGYISLKKLNIKDPILAPWKGGGIKIGSAEYHFVLAYLYRHLKKEGLALTQLEQMVDVKLTQTEKEQQGGEYIDMYNSVLRYFIARSQFVKARKAAETLVELYSSQEDLEGLETLYKYLVANGMDESAENAASALIFAYEDEKDSDGLLMIFNLLIQNKMQKLAKKVGNRLIELYGSNQDLEGLMKISELLSTNQMPELATEALERASAISASVHQKILLARHLIDNGKEVSAKIFIDQAIEGLDSMKGEKRIDGTIEMARFLFEIGGKPRAANLLDSLIPETQSIDQILKIAKAACKLEFFSIAIHAVEFAVYDRYSYGDVTDYDLPSPHLLAVSRFLPTEENINLATYFGILQEKGGKPEDAQYSYKAALQNDLEAILRSCGYDISGNINEFFYLKQLWQQTYPDKLNLIMPLYSYLQEQVLKDLRVKEQKDIIELKDRVRALKRQRTDLIATSEKNRADRGKTYFDMVILGLRALAISLTLLIIMTGWVVKGILHAKLLSCYKFFGFCWKFLESMGWSACFSVVGVLAGIPMIVFSQFMEIIHANQQGVEKLGYAESTNMIKEKGLQTESPMPSLEDEDNGGAGPIRGTDSHTETE